VLLLPIQQTGRKNALQYLFRIGSWGEESKYPNSSDSLTNQTSITGVQTYRKLFGLIVTTEIVRKKKLAQILTGNL